MSKRSTLLLAMGLLVLTAAGCRSDAEKAAVDPAGEAAQAAATQISGRLENGLRVLTFFPGETDQRLTIYRGDYVRPEWTGGEPFTLEIPSLQLAQEYPVSGGDKSYFKVPEAGSFAFRLSGPGGSAAAGVIEAIEYLSSNYREVTSAQAAQMIAEVDPLLLDVRTPREFAQGHLEGAVLVPVQELQRRLAELAPHRQDPILVYCRTGNRSTVAAQLLIDAGFTQVANLRRGIVEWNREGRPVTR